MTTLEKAINALKKDGINSALIEAMTDDEILKTFSINDYYEYNRYIKYLSRKYDI